MANHYVCCRAAGRLRHVSSKHDFDLLSLLQDTSERVLLWAPFWCKYISHGRTLISAITIDNLTINHQRAPFHPERELSRSHSRTQWGGVAHTRERMKKGNKTRVTATLGMRGRSAVFCATWKSPLIQRQTISEQARCNNGQRPISPPLLCHTQQLNKRRPRFMSVRLSRAIHHVRLYIMPATLTCCSYWARTPFFSPWCRADGGNARAPYSH